jgi:hypothetical protein
VRWVLGLKGAGEGGSSAGNLEGWSAERWQLEEDGAARRWRRGFGGNKTGGRWWAAIGTRTAPVMDGDRKNKGGRENLWDAAHVVLGYAAFDWRQRG